MICKNCKASIPDDSMFCPSCGQKVEAKPVAAPAPTFSSAFHYAGSLDGSGSGIGAPVVEKKPAAPQEDGGLRFSSSFKCESESSVPHSSKIAHADDPTSMSPDYNARYDANEKGDIDSLPIPTPSYNAPAVVIKATAPEGDSSVRIPSNFKRGELAQGKKSATKQIHPDMASNGYPFIEGKTSDVQKKKSVWKYVCAGILAVVVVLISAFFITKAQSPWFKVNSAGKLSFDLNVWKFYHFYNTNSSIEIPQEYDGAIQNISPDNELQYHTLRYEGDLEEFFAEHSWAVAMMQDYGHGKVECRDCTFSFNKSGHGAVFIEDDSARYIVTGNYSISNRRGKEILFESWSLMRRWLDTGIYEYSWTDLYGRTHYDEVEITLD